MMQQRHAFGHLGQIYFPMNIEFIRDLLSALFFITVVVSKPARTIQGDAPWCMLLVVDSSIVRVLENHLRVFQV